MNKKIYIAGKVTGLPEKYVEKKFNKVQHILEAIGYKVINPINEVLKHGDGWATNWEDAMYICIEAMLDADIVFFMWDWRESEGAKLEYKICINLGITAIHSINSLKPSVRIVLKSDNHE